MEKTQRKEEIREIRSEGRAVISRVSGGRNITSETKGAILGKVRRGEGAENWDGKQRK